MIFFPTIDVFGNGFLPNHDKDNIVFMFRIILSPKAEPLLIKHNAAERLTERKLNYRTISFIRSFLILC